MATKKKRAHGHRWDYVALGHRVCRVKGCGVEQKWSTREPKNDHDLEALLCGFRDETGMLAKDARR